MTPAAKTYSRRMLAFAIAYTVALLGVNVLDDMLDLSTPVRIALALIPVAPAAFAMFAIISFVRAMDEVQARIITESVLIAAVIVSLGTFTYGMLRGAVELPAIEAFWYLPALIAVAGLAQVFVARRYR